MENTHNATPLQNTNLAQETHAARVRKVGKIMRKDDTDAYIKLLLADEEAKYTTDPNRSTQIDWKSTTLTPDRYRPDDKIVKKVYVGSPIWEAGQQIQLENIDKYIEMYQDDLSRSDLPDDLRKQLGEGLKQLKEKREELLDYMKGEGLVHTFNMGRRSRKKSPKRRRRSRSRRSRRKPRRSRSRRSRRKPRRSRSRRSRRRRSRRRRSTRRRRSRSRRSRR